MAPPTNSHLTTPEAEFLRSVLAQIDQTWEEPEPIYDLFRTNLDKLNEALLGAIPQVFEERLTGKSSQSPWRIATFFKFFSTRSPQSPWRIAAFFDIFGNRIGEFPLGKRAVNLEISIAAYEAALQVYTRDAFPQDWAMTQNNLGTAYGDRIQSERADNLERAIAAFEAALQVRTRDAFPQQWAMTQNNLGLAYGNRIRGERADNLERAIAAFEAALQVYTRDTFPDDWAWTQGNLISALLERSKLTGNADDLDTAIAALAEAGTVAIPGTDSYVWIQQTLGTALDYRFSLHKDPTDLRQAAAAYHRAADTTPWASDQTYYYEKAADSQYQLGVALTQDGQWYNGLAALEASHATYREAHSRLGRADALQQMGRAHYLMSNFDKAGIYFRDALRIYKAEASLPGQAACHAGLGRLMLRLNFIDDAIAELHQACQLYTQLNDDARLSEIQQVYDLAQKVKAKQPLAATPSPPPP